MADEPGSERPRSKLATAVMLVGLCAAAGVAGVVFSLVQRPAFRPELPTVIGSSAPIRYGPFSAQGFTVADDPAIHRVLLFGGVDSDNQTWLWDGSRWTRARPAASPPGRYQAAAAYDPQTRVVLLFGGRLATGKVATDTWAWSGTAWRQLDSGAGGPPGEGALMAWDSSSREMVLVTPTTQATGGETWVWSGSHWTPQRSGQSLPTPIAAEMAFDPGSNGLLFVSALLPPMGVGITAWRFDGRVWQRLAATPPASTDGLALDPTSGRLLLYSDPTPDTFPQLWRWAGGAWARVPRSILTVQEGVEATDLDRGLFLIFGFDTPTNEVTALPVHVWGWNGRAWRELDAVTTG